MDDQEAIKEIMRKEGEEEAWNEYRKNLCPSCHRYGRWVEEADEIGQRLKVCKCGYEEVM